MGDSSRTQKQTTTLGKGLKEFIQQAQVLGRDRSPRLRLWLAGGVVGLTAARQGHWRGRHRCGLRLWVSWNGIVAHRNVSCGLRGEAGGWDREGPRWSWGCVAGAAGGRVAWWLEELGLGGAPTPERSRRGTVRSKEEQKNTWRQKKSLRH